ncbi:ADP-ribose diphosphatase [Malassezia caprae]|uniref:ADP-ribose diphosphatase n=1 Tax=Malassezia caprae TaxID=1381934 RepID=A0AAF0EA38_9BASI|nr:ADP-ribose diphosphatase [Malassezia caprae]
MSSAFDIKQSRVLQSRPLSNDDAKWVGLRAIDWKDAAGKARVWESADPVAILAIVKRPSVDPHVLLVSQFRPPVGYCVIELPAGLIDSGEEGDQGAKEAALRELREETGYGDKAQGASISIKSLSTIMYNDPGLTGANMKLCVIDITLESNAPEPLAEPDEGEYIEKHLVPLRQLSESLHEFEARGYAIDARLAHIAEGISLGIHL